MDYKLTVLMPLYNRQDYISEAIDSVLAQKTDFDFKLIVIDDASTDDSLKIVESYQKRYPKNIEIIKNEVNLKLLRTILKGYENTKTDYFCVLDPDDYWIDEYKLQKAFDFLEKNQDFTIYATDTYLLTEDGLKKPYINIDKEFVDSDFNDYLKDKAVLGCSLGGVFRNVVFKNGVPPVLYNMIDSKYSIAFRADSFRNLVHLKEGKAHFVNEIDGVYRLHSDSLWSSSTELQKISLLGKFYLGMFYYFDMIEPEFFLREIRSEDFINIVIEFLKKETNINDSKDDIVNILELVLNMQVERAKFSKYKD